MIGGSNAPFRTAAQIVSLDELSESRERFADRSIVLCHGAFDLVHMGHLIHFEDARGARRHARRHHHRRPLHHQEALRLVQRRVSRASACRARNRRLRRRRRRAVGGRARSRRCGRTSTSRVRSTRNLVLDKTANIFREKALVESYGGRLHFTNGNTFSSTKLAHFLLAAPEASQGNPLLRNDRVLFRDLSALDFTLERAEGLPGRGGRLRVCLIGETIIDEWVDVAVTNLSHEIALRRGSRAPRAAARSAAPASSPSICRASSSTSTASPTVPAAADAGQRRRHHLTSIAAW